MSGSYRFPTADDFVVCLCVCSSVCLFVCFVMFAMRSCGFSFGWRKKFLIILSCAFAKLLKESSFQFSLFLCFVLLSCLTNLRFIAICGRVSSLAWRHYHYFPGALISSFCCFCFSDGKWLGRWLGWFWMTSDYFCDIFIGNLTSFFSERLINPFL